MKKILYYGNCQVGALHDIIKKSFFNCMITIVLCWLDNIEKNYFLEKIREADIIITQPIKPNYKNTDYLHTEYILENANPNAKIFIFTSLHFDFYYWDLSYKFLKDNTLLREPSDYHYNELINFFTSKKNQSDFINEIINNANLKSKTELENIATSSICELKKRETEMNKYSELRDCHIITSSNFINDNYKKKLLFYSMNHPTKYVLQNIAEKIVTLLKIDSKIDYNIDPLHISERGIIYKCIEKVVDFNIENHKPRLSKYNMESIEDIVNKYYEIYEKSQL